MDELAAVADVPAASDDGEAATAQAAADTGAEAKEEKVQDIELAPEPAGDGAGGDTGDGGDTPPASEPDIPPIADPASKSATSDSSSVSVQELKSVAEPTAEPDLVATDAPVPAMAADSKRESAADDALVAGEPAAPPQQGATEAAAPTAESEPVPAAQERRASPVAVTAASSSSDDGDDDAPVSRPSRPMSSRTRPLYRPKTSPAEAPVASDSLSQNDVAYSLGPQEEPVTATRQADPHRPPVTEDELELTPEPRVAVADPEPEPAVADAPLASAATPTTDDADVHSKAVSASKPEPAVADAPLASSKATPTTDDADAESKAAVLIQASYRGHAARTAQRQRQTAANGDEPDGGGGGGGSPVGAGAAQVEAVAEPVIVDPSIVEEPTPLLEVGGAGVPPPVVDALAAVDDADEVTTVFKAPTADSLSGTVDISTALESAASDTPTTDDANAEAKAAVVIQASFRGHAARTALRQVASGVPRTDATITGEEPAAAATPSSDDVGAKSDDAEPAANVRSQETKQAQEDKRLAKLQAMINGFDIMPPMVQNMFMELSAHMAQRNKTLQDLFTQLDLDECGLVTPKEFEHGLMARGILFSPEQISEFMKAVDGNNDGAIDFHELCMLESKLKEDTDESDHHALHMVFTKVESHLTTKRVRLVDLFRKLDVGNTGGVATNKFIAGLKGHGVQLTNDQARLFRKSADADGDGQFMYKELHAWRNASKRTARRDSINSGVKGKWKKGVTKTKPAKESEVAHPSPPPAAPSIQLSRLKQVQLVYTGLFRELLQRADQAEATEFSVCYGYGLPAGLIADAGTRALYIYFNASYSPADLELVAKVGIEHLGLIGDAGAASIDSQVPPFGSGFSECSRVSTSMLVTSGVTSSSATSVVFTDTSESSGKVLSAASEMHQWMLDGMKACHRDEADEGTLLLLPISGQHAEHDMKQAIAAFKAAANPTLLFSKRLNQLRWRICPQAGNKLGTSMTVYEAALQLPDSYSIRADPNQQRSFLEDTWGNGGNGASRTSLVDLTVAISTGHPKVEGGVHTDTSNWLVAQCSASGPEIEAAASAALSDDSLDVPAIPVAAVAALVDAAGSNVRVLPTAVAGQICRFSPLNASEELSGLPVHVHGLFALGLDATIDKSGPGGDWNVAMVTHVLAPAYAKLLEELAVRCLPSAMDAGFRSVLPSPTMWPWNILAKSTWRCLHRTPFLASVAAPLAWNLSGTGSDVAFGQKITMWRQRRSISTRVCTVQSKPEPLSKQVRWWRCAPKDALFFVEDKRWPDLPAILGAFGLPVVVCTTNDALYAGAMSMSTTDELPISWVSPKLVREQLKRAPPAVISAALAGVPHNGAELLRYAVSDKCNMIELLGFPIPLQNGGATRLLRCSAAAVRTIYVAPAFLIGELFSGDAGHRVLHTSCSNNPELRELIFDQAETSRLLNLQPLTLTAIRHILLPRCLPDTWLEATNIQKPQPDENEMAIPIAFPGQMDPMGWRCCDTLYHTGIVICKHCGTRSAFIEEQLEVLTPHFPTGLPVENSSMPWNSIKDWECQKVNGGPAAAWLDRFWTALTDLAEVGLCTWDEVLSEFEDVALLPGDNDVIYPLGAEITPIIELDRVKPPLKSLLVKLGGCRPYQGYPMPPDVLDSTRVNPCVNPANGIGCLTVVSWCVSRDLEKHGDSDAEKTFSAATGEERHALLRMLGAMREYTRRQLLLVAALPIVEVWSNPSRGPSARMSGTMGKRTRSFISVLGAIKRKEMFVSDRTNHICLRRGRNMRSLVLQRDGPNDQFNAGVVALLQACAEAVLEDSRGDRIGPRASIGAEGEFGGGGDGFAVRTLHFAQKYRTRSTRDDSMIASRSFSKKMKWPDDKLRNYPKPWLVNCTVPSGAPIDDDVTSTTTVALGPLRRPMSAPPGMADTAGRRKTGGRGRSKSNISPTQHSRELRQMTSRVNHRTQHTVGLMAMTSSDEHHQDDSWSDLHCACGAGDLKAALAIVRSNRNEVRQVATGGLTPLLLAAVLGHLDIAKLLVACGASVNQCLTTLSAASPLIAAAYNGHVDMVRFLVAHGAHVDYPCADTGATAVVLARSQRQLATAEFLKGIGSPRPKTAPPNSVGRRRSLNR